MWRPTHARRLCHHAANDPFGVAYTYATRPIEFGSEWEFFTAPSGIVVPRPVVGSRGPIGGWFRWAPTGGRSLAQWQQVGWAKVTTASPLKVTPVKTTAGTPDPFVLDTTLGEVQVTAPQGYSPTVGDYGTVLQGTDLGSVQLIFVPHTASSGGGGTFGPWWGDASDGSITLDGTTPALGGPDVNGAYIFTQNRASAIDNTTVNGFGVYYLHRETQLDTLTFAANVVLCTIGQGPHTLVARKVVGPASSVISSNPVYDGNIHTIGTPCRGWLTGFSGGAYGNIYGNDGGSGSTGAGANAVSQSYSSIPVPGSASGTFGKGGNGGAASGGAGGLGSAPIPDPSHWARRIRHFDGGAYAGPPGNIVNLFANKYPAGGAGGSGAGDGASAGGFGGGGAGWNNLYVQDLSTFLGTVDASGSPGHPGTGGDAAGGGGGGGGLNRVWTDPAKTPSKVWNTTQAAGAGGAGSGAGAAGAAGGAGLSLGTYP